MGVFLCGFFAKRGKCICGPRELLLNMNSIQDTVQVSVTPNIMNTNVLVEKEQSLKNMTIFRALEIIVYIFTVTYAVGSTLLILLLE